MISNCHDIYLICLSLIAPRRRHTLLTMGAPIGNHTRPHEPFLEETWELFAQARVRGTKCPESYAFAGFKAKTKASIARGAHHLNVDSRMRARIAWLKANPALTKDETLRLLACNARDPRMPQGQRLSAVKETASLMGWHNHSRAGEADQDATATAEASRQLAAAAQELVDEQEGGEGGEK